MTELQWSGDAMPSAGAIEGNLFSPIPATPGESGIWRLARTVTAFRQGRLEGVIGTAYSNLHPDREWLVLDLRFWVTGPAPIEVGRDDFSLARRDGSRLILPGREEVTSELSNIGRTLIAASAVEDPLDRYVPRGLVPERLPFSTRKVVESIVLGVGRIATGKLLFRTPRGTRLPAAYLLRIANREVDARIPFRLPAGEPLAPGARSRA